MLAREERQRLTDLADQFDSLMGDAQLEENFQFWRGYLRDKVSLHETHPGHLESLESARAGELAEALAFIAALDGNPDARARTLADGFSGQPFLVNFLPAVDDGTLVKLFAAGYDLPEGPTLQATASFVQRLQRFGTLVEQVLAEGRRSHTGGARALQEFLADTGYENEQDLRLFFDLFANTDRQLARRVMGEIDNATIRSLIVPVPVQLRNILGPDELLDKLDITEDAADDHLRRGIALLVEESSGNYRIDEPFLEHLYEVMAERTAKDPEAAAQVFAATPLPLDGMLAHQPEAAVAALSSDPVLAVSLVRNGDPVLSPPASIIYRVIRSNPDLAGELVVSLDALGGGGAGL